MSTAVQAPAQNTQASRWTIDPAHTAAHFSVRHLMISNVRGEFTKITGTALIDPMNLAQSAVEVTIDAKSINTREPQRDDHLRSADFFDVANFPTLSFRSTGIEIQGGEELKLTGDLTIHGVTKEVTFDVEGPTPEIKDPWGNVRAGVTAATKISRKNFGLTFNALTDTGGVVVGDEVKITLEAELIRQADPA
ncbi:MAG TPA: YceI family protein [Candidatus Acidoferrales bacterium]|jgi:polyisoprenoid-binding protein YceI|nr:YceI family protein [Candidatus Acidoferrales bacterium]